MSLDSINMSPPYAEKAQEILLVRQKSRRDISMEAVDCAIITDLQRIFIPCLLRQIMRKCVSQSTHCDLHLGNSQMEHGTLP